MLRIGVTDCSKYTNYSKWIEAAAPDIETIKLSFTNAGAHVYDQCDAILFSGGEDIHPSLYNKPEYMDFCYPDDVSLRRDEFEWQVMEYAGKNEVPVLGVCRGLQFINVFFGGTLIPDIPTWGKYNHSKLQDGSDRYHAVHIDPSSWLYRITGTDSGTINSNHHQSADRIGRGFVVSAVSPDGIVEALEKKDPDKGGYISLVQWHPERMTDQGSVLVKNIRSSFIDSARNFTSIK